MIHNACYYIAGIYFLKGGNVLYTNKGYIKKFLVMDNLKFHGHMDFRLYDRFESYSHKSIFFTHLLKECAKLGIKSAFVTCEDDNIELRKIIESHEHSFLDRISRKDCNHYISIRRYLVDTGYKLKDFSLETFSPNIENLIYIYGKEISLELNKIYGKNASAIESFEYHMKDKKENIAGRITFTTNIHKNIYYLGNIGYNVKEKHRGNNYAQIATQMLYNAMIENGYKYDVFITVSPDNIASLKTCENAGARLLEIVKIPPDNYFYKHGDRYKYRYVLNN